MHHPAAAGEEAPGPPRTHDRQPVLRRFHPHRTSLRSRAVAERRHHQRLRQAVRSSKGESMRDTMMTPDSMGVDAFVIRHSSSGAVAQAASWVKAQCINAGDGSNEHPTQALLDAFRHAPTLPHPRRGRLLRRQTHRHRRRPAAQPRGPPRMCCRSARSAANSRW
ncbi:MAG: hypothetical protein IPM11_00190 [Micropruina sp.]|nr:hypothetical protein [Micropruina sp.]